MCFVWMEFGSAPLDVVRNLPWANHSRELWKTYLMYVEFSHQLWTESGCLTLSTTPSLRLNSFIAYSAIRHIPSTLPNVWTAARRNLNSWKEILSPWAQYLYHLILNTFIFSMHPSVWFMMASRTIARSLSIFAAKNWSRQPSPKKYFC